MTIYLARHGEAEHDALTARGRTEVTRIAEVAEGYGVRVQRIEHSHKRRALQTAEIMAAHLRPAKGSGERAGIAPLDDVVPVAAALDPGSDLMLVGHLPFMERLLGALIAKDPELRVFKVQAGGLICVDQDAGGWFIRWALMPRVS